MEIFCITKCITNLYNKACPSGEQPTALYSLSFYLFISLTLVVFQLSLYSIPVVFLLAQQFPLLVPLLCPCCSSTCPLVQFQLYSSCPRCLSIFPLVSPSCSPTILSAIPFPFLISLLEESSIFWEAPPFLYWVKGVWKWIDGYIFY